MTDIWIFGGTTEGRRLAEYCAAAGQRALVSVVSGYGEQVLPKDCCLTILRQAMDVRQMEDTLEKEKVKLVIDATHPYAAQVSKHIREACERRKVRVLRVLRTSESGGQWEAEAVRCASTEEAVRYLTQTEGRILVTTGSKELGLFTKLPDYENRIYARVLPDSRVLSQCESLGFWGGHVIAMQGPFGEELNAAVMRQFSIRYLVTKEAGQAGGYMEKLKAAAACGVVPVIIGRPDEEEGISVEAACSVLNSMGGRKRQIHLIGIGMGAVDQMTLGAVQALKRCRVLLGAPRMLACVEGLNPTCQKEPVYLRDAVAAWLFAHPEETEIGIVMSGDTGFYSGARKLLQLFEEEPFRRDYQVSVIPGISSVSCLCARLHTSWEDVYLASMHGRDCDVAELLKTHRRIFCLTGGAESVKELCRGLIKAGFSEARVSLGENLSYPEERIVTGTPKTLLEEVSAELGAVLIERE